MSRTLHLSIATPQEKVVDSTVVRSIRATDESGGFGILPGHADLLTVLPPSVVRWREGDGAEHFCAVQGGVLTLTGGTRLAIACRRAVRGDRLDDLEADIASVRTDENDADRRARVAQMQLHARAVRQLMRYLAPSTDSGMSNMFSDGAV